MSKAFSDEKVMIIVVFSSFSASNCKKIVYKSPFLKKTLDNVFFCLHLAWWGLVWATEQKRGFPNESDLERKKETLSIQRPFCQLSLTLFLDDGVLLK